MRLIIKAKNIDFTNEVEDFIETKFSELERFLPETTEVFVEVGKLSLHHQKGNVFYVGCQISLPVKKLLRVNVEKENLKVGVREAVKKMEQALKKHKEKEISKK